MTAPGVRDPGDTPGESEFSWGEGPMPNPNQEPPNPFDDLKAAFDVNRKADQPEAVEEYRYPYPKE